MTSRRRIILTFLLIDVLVLPPLIWWFLQRPPQKSEPVVPPAVSSVTAPKGESATSLPAGQDSAQAAAGATLPQAPAGQVERHGTFRGEPFWLRLSAPDPAFAGLRKLELVFTPTAPEKALGSLLHDSPIFLLDENLRVVQWDNRDGATGVRYLDEEKNYRVVRERKEPDNDTVKLLRRTLAVPKGWPLEIAPLLAVLVEGDSWSVPVYDFWGERVAEHLTVERDGAAVQIAGAATQITATGLSGAELDVVIPSP